MDDHDGYTHVYEEPAPVTAHSPLPWCIGSRNGNDPTAHCAIDSEDEGWSIADVWADCEALSPEVAQANAEFIVRACNAHADLLAALKALRDAVIRHGVTEGDGPEWLAAFQGLMSAVRSADDVIAKAEAKA